MRVDPRGGDGDVLRGPRRPDDPRWDRRARRRDDPRRARPQRGGPPPARRARVPPGGRERTAARCPRRPTVLITAHGISDGERARLEAAGKTLVDTTCPLVARAHQAAQALQRPGIPRPRDRQAGPRRGPRDRRGPRRFDVVETPEDARPHRRRPARDRLPDHGPPAQGGGGPRRRSRRRTRAPRSGSSTPSAARRRSISGRSIACSSRSRRWSSSAAGTRTTRASWPRPAGLAGVPAYHVQGPADLDPAWFAGFESVGLTAGTSTLDETIDEVHERLLDLADRPRRRGLRPDGAERPMTRFPGRAER